MNAKTRRRSHDVAAFCLGLLCLVVAGGAFFQVAFGFATAVLQIALPVILVLLAILAMFGLRR